MHIFQPLHTFLTTLIMISAVLCCAGQPLFAGDEGNYSYKWQLKTNGEGIAYLSAHDIDKVAQNQTSNVYWMGAQLPATWKFQSGDNPSFASPALDDRAWQTVNTALPSNSPNPSNPNANTTQPNASNWPGIGWFRLHLRIDSSLFNKSVALMVEQGGASEIYLNGHLIQRNGIVSADRTKEQRYLPVWEPITLTFGSERDYVLAVRYSHTQSQSLRDLYGSFAKDFGFMAFIKNLQQAIDDASARTKGAFVFNIIAVGLLGAFTLLHALLFMFYPQQRVNLYYSLFTATLMFRFWVIYALNTTTNPDLYPFLMSAQVFYSTALVGFYVAFLYSVFYEKMPKHIWAIAASCVAYSITLFFNFENQPVRLFWMVFMSIFALEGVRVSVQAIRKKQSGAWILGFGALDFALMWVFRSTVEIFSLNISKPTAESITFTGYLAMPLAMSLFVARFFSQTNKSLATQLAQVQELSKKTLDQERHAHERDLRQRLLQADNDRKTRELEEARALQLAMLPRSAPDHPRFELAAYMKTATEVGGDYYDFKVAPDGTLLAAVGDATGHGMKAGFLVSTAKSYVQALAQNDSSSDALQRISLGIRTMNMRGMYMCLSLAKFSNHNVTLAVAGMPPVLIYRAQTQTVEQVLVKALPLGSVEKFAYEERTVPLADNDVFLMMSDGLPELFNAQGEMLDYERIETFFKSVAHESPDHIIEQLSNYADEWSSDAVIRDDITMLAVKVRPVKTSTNGALHTAAQHEAALESL